MGHGECAPRPPQTKMPAIKLTYFDLRARAEPARLLLAYSGQSYEDKRIPAPWDAPETWAAIKKTLAFGQLPKLEWDGTTIYTSLSIARFLATPATRPTSWLTEKLRLPPWPNTREKPS